MRDAWRSLVYVDAFIPDDGQSVLDFMPESNQTALRELGAEPRGTGGGYPPVRRAWIGGG